MNPSRPVRYPSIGDYALIGDSRCSALVSLDGSIDWLCLPNFDSPSVFGRLLDWDRGGHFRIAPLGEYGSKHEYIDETNVLRTTFETADGSVDVIDFMPAQDEQVKRRLLEPLRSVVRIVEGRSGRVPMRIDFVPRPDYGRANVYLRAHTPFELTISRGRNNTHFRSDVPLDRAAHDARATFEVSAGARRRFVMAYSFEEPAVIVSDQFADEAYDHTIAFWKNWAAQFTYDGPYRDQVARSALTLKLLSYAPSGAIAAAPTMSLPEEIGGERNWDYRYCWIRDAALTVKAFLGIGLRAEARAFSGWLTHATHQTAPVLHPLYSLHGEPSVPEHVLDHLEGYRQSRPVHVGNGACHQYQFDVYGELIDAIHSFLNSEGGRVSAADSRYIAGIADHVADNWRRPDNGIWEQRTPPQHYTQSKVMAWDALHHAAALERDGKVRGDAERWEREADAIHREVLARGFNHDLQSFTQTLDGDRLDAAVLMMPIVGFLDPHDSRMTSTIDAIRRRLEVNGFVKRYESEDGLPGEEGAFIACNFWLAAALAQTRRTEEAHEVFDASLRAANDVGLLAEEVDPHTIEPLGNFPQGLSHISLIAAALAISHAESGRPDLEHQWPIVTQA